jgi:phosphoribosylanthranilate isomerase
VIKARSVRSDEEIAAMADYAVRAFLVDAHDPVRFGGTGKTCNWNLAHRAAARHPLILAGGLSEENVIAALEAVRPLAVDISSGVETAPGKKDHEKIRSVIAAVRHFSWSGPVDTNKRIFKKT